MASLLGVGRPAGQTGHPRQPSTPLYTLFSPAQIKQFREAFSLVDVDRDGVLSPSDVQTTLANLGLPSAPADVDAFFPLSPGAAAAGKPDGGVSFTQFLTAMGDKLLRLDGRPALEDAFASFDADDVGVVRIDELREWLGTTGDRLGEDELDALLSSRFADHRQGTFDYKAFARSLEVNEPAEAAPGADGNGGEDGRA